MPLFGPEQYSILPDSIVERDDLPQLIHRAEMAVLDRYSVVRPDGSVVKLRGYDPDPAQCAPELLMRLRYVIADVIEHGVNMPDENVQSVSRGARSVSFRRIVHAMPRTAFRLLDDFDDRAPLWRV